MFSHLMLVQMTHLIYWTGNVQRSAGYTRPDYTTQAQFLLLCAMCI